MSDARSLFEEAKNSNLDAVHQLEKLANLVTPNLIAINNLGVCYEFGYGVVQDQAKAVTLYRRAADLGDDSAMCNLGLANQAGRGTPLDISWAAHWYLEAAKKNTKNLNGTIRAIRELEALSTAMSPNAVVLNNLAVCYEFGYGTTLDPTKALLLYRQAAELGNDTAMCNLGLAYQKGLGVSIDISSATFWFFESAKRNTTNPNGSPRAIEQLEKLVKESSPHKDAVVSLAICYEEGYSVPKDSKKSLDLFTKAGMQSLSQNNSRRKLASYLKDKSRNPDIIKIFEDRGHCFGFTFLALYAKWLQDQPVRLGADGNPTPRDDYKWLSDTLTRLNHWDGISPLSKEDENHFERLISLLISHQSSWYNLPMKQGDFENYNIDSRERRLQQEYSIAARFTQPELSERLPLIIHEGKLTFLISHTHCIGFIKLGEIFYFIDSENPNGLITVNTIDDLCRLIFSAFHYSASIPSPLALSIFGFHENKLENKDALIETKYPTQESLLKDLRIFDSKYESQTQHNYASGYTDLHRACWIGCKASIKFILDRNKNNSEYINQREVHGYTALMMAAFNGQNDAAEQLIHAGANINLVNNNQYSAIALAATNGFTSVITRLIERGANQKDLALTVAAREGHIETVLKLIESKADVNHRASDGCTALSLAAKNNHPNVVRLLLANGADITLPGQNGLTALDIAMQCNNTLLLKILLSHLLDIYEKKLDERKEEYNPRMPLLSFISKGYSKTMKKAAVADAREALRDDRPISSQYRAVLNNSKLKVVITALRKHQTIKLKLGL